MSKMIKDKGLIEHFDVCAMNWFTVKRLQQTLVLDLYTEILHGQFDTIGRDDQLPDKQD